MSVEWGVGNIANKIVTFANINKFMTATSDALYYTVGFDGSANTSIMQLPANAVLDVSNAQYIVKLDLEGNYLSHIAYPTNFIVSAIVNDSANIYAVLNNTVTDSSIIYKYNTGLSSPSVIADISQNQSFLSDLVLLGSSIYASASISITGGVFGSTGTYIVKYSTTGAYQGNVFVNAYTIVRPSLDKTSLSIKGGNLVISLPDDANPTRFRVYEFDSALSSVSDISGIGIPGIIGISGTTVIQPTLSLTPRQVLVRAFNLPSSTPAWTITANVSVSNTTIDFYNISTFGNKIYFVIRCFSTTANTVTITDSSGGTLVISSLPFIIPGTRRQCVSAVVVFNQAGVLSTFPYTSNSFIQFDEGNIFGFLPTSSASYMYGNNTFSTLLVPNPTLFINTEPEYTFTDITTSSYGGPYFTVFLAKLVQAGEPPVTPQPGVSVVPAYVPSQSERADQLHQLQCPCADTVPGPTDYAVRGRRIRSLATGCCGTWAIVDITVTGGANYAVGDLLQLVGGVPIAKPLLVRVSAVDGSGGITGIVIVYPGQYSQKPVAPYTMTRLSGSGTGSLIVTISWTETCPCPWAYRRAGSSGLNQGDCCS